MNKIKIIWKIIPVIILGLIFLPACFRQKVVFQNQVCFQQKCIQVEVVQKEEDLRRGLQGRASLDSNSGMLFVFPESRRQGFWMKDTLIPLDMIWMDYSRRVVYTAQRVPPCLHDPCRTYTPDEEAMYVLEVNAGYAEILGIKEGTRCEFKLKDINRNFK